MEKLAEQVEQLKHNEVAKVVAERMQQFQQCFESEETVFSELCFCIVTANNRAVAGLRVQEAIDAGFSNWTQQALSELLLKSNSRFHINKGKYLMEAIKHKNVKAVLQQMQNEFEMREWLVKNVKGIGYKEASHFLRNIGFKKLAILDRHIMRVMQKHGLIDDVPKPITRTKYLEMEKKLSSLAKATCITQAELDLYLWFMQTGKVLK